MAKTQPDHAIDMVFVIPAETLQEKDYLDLRYFHKRAYVLGVIVAALQNDFKDEAQLSYEYLNGNALCPIVSIRANIQGADSEEVGNASTSRPLNYRIRVIPSAPDSFFPNSKLQARASLLRKGRDDEPILPLQPTPFYNSTLAAEGCFLPYLKTIRLAEKKCASFRNASILGRIWLQQRGFGSDISEGGFGCFEWSLLLALLLQGGDGKGSAALSASLKSTQLFKAVVQFLSVTNFAEKPCVLGASKASIDMPDASGPVIYDTTHQMNIAFKMSPWSAVLLHRHAKWTRTLLNDGTVDQFDPSFILKADISLHSFDLVSRLNNFGSFDPASEADAQSNTWKFGNKVYRVLKQALCDRDLGERARLIDVRIPKSSPWSLAEKPKSFEIAPLEVRILFDAANMARTVDRGPPAGSTPEEKDDCERFRRFWGPKAELRRFEGDTIRETVIWESSSAFGLCQEIMRYILSLHLHTGALEGDMAFYGSELHDILSLKPTDSVVFNVAKNAFADFERDLRDLQDLPLHVRRLAPICPELRHASVKPPALGPSKLGLLPMETVISFEASGKWPENLAAIQRTKIAFLLMIGRLLGESKARQVKTLVGLEDAGSEIENLAFLDVVYESGATFRLRIHSDLEEILLERQLRDKMQEQHVRTKATALLGRFRRLYTHLPLHSQTISTFVTRFPALSPTIRLLKQWFNAHRLSCHFNDELLELIALHVFLSPYPWDAPSSANTGFFRALLFLARWDWRSEPLVLDTGGDMPQVDRTAIATRLEAWRKIDPNMNHTVIFVATAQDATGLAYTSRDGHARPSKVVATRMTALAKSACQVVKDEGIGLEPKKLFVSSLKDYDFLLHLNRKLVNSATKTYLTEMPEDIATDSPAKPSKFKNLDERTGQNPLPLAQHPTEALMKQLSEKYSGALVFFYGLLGDTKVGGIWNPHVQRKKFRVNLPTSYKPGGESTSTVDDSSDEATGDMDVNLNKEAILAEIARIGGDLIEKIDTKGL